MPDGDVFTRSVAPGWQNLASAVRDGLSPEECARWIEDGLAKALRKAGGLAHPGLENLLSADNVDESLVADRLADLVRCAAFDRIMPLLVAQGRYTNYEDAQQFMAFCIDAARMDVLARSLARHRDGKGVRRPARPHSTISELLSEPAPLGGQA